MDIQINRAWPTAARSSPQALPEHRRRDRLLVSVPVRLRAVDGNDDQGEVQTTVNFNRNGLYFETDRDQYCLGMRLLVALPYCAGAICQEYAGKVVRIESLGDGRYGVAVRFLYIEARILIATK